VQHALEFAFSVITPGTILEGAEIEILKIPILLYCQNCETEYIGDIEDLHCPACLGEKFNILQGREMMVKYIEGE